MKVCYFKQDYNYSGNKALLAMTDYTQHESLPFQEGDGKVNGKATILVTLWDEHLNTALKLNVGVGHLLYLKNLLCKFNKNNNNIELRMNGARPGRGYTPSEPIRVLDSKDPAVVELRLRQAKYKQTQSGAKDEIPKVEPSTSQLQSTAGTNHSPELTTIPAARSPSAGASTIAATLTVTATRATSELRSIKKEIDPPQDPKSPLIKRSSNKAPTPAPQPRAPSLDLGLHPTRE
ncbi:hypothetical protein BGZ76_001350 [Entomortierella beljakovae]|nr:hypothetical protein BGZ76_001350 [Entomortierella beljakovae]